MHVPVVVLLSTVRSRSTYSTEYGVRSTSTKRPSLTIPSSFSALPPSFSSLNSCPFISSQTVLIPFPYTRFLNLSKCGLTRALLQEKTNVSKLCLFPQATTFLRKVWRPEYGVHAWYIQRCIASRRTPGSVQLTFHILLDSPSSQARTNSIRRFVLQNPSPDNNSKCPPTQPLLPCFSQSRSSSAVLRPSTQGASTILQKV